MKNNSIPAQRTFLYWWTYLLTGIVLFISGILVLRSQASNYAGMSAPLGWLMLLLGLAHAAFVILNHKKLAEWPSHLFTGLLDIALGLKLIFDPDITMSTLPFWVSAWFLIKAISLINYSLGLEKWSCRALLTGGALTFMSGIFILFSPFPNVFTIVIWTAIAFMISGMFYILLSFCLHNYRVETDPITV
ncbi:MAG TPA: DUF308 domain-containing protein [Chitinophagaceae bacterium]|jgi:uncharacterized membrane protein HdeD (DUF308 family)|nr:DUF308 domain-containing protein [Chitinophagaceae bacterium]